MRNPCSASSHAAPYQSSVPWTACRGGACRRRQANCDQPPSTNAYVYAYDFGNTTMSRFDLSLWYNNTNDLNTTQGPPDAQRVNQASPPCCAVTVRAKFVDHSTTSILFAYKCGSRLANSSATRLFRTQLQGINMATNAYVQWALGTAYSVRLLGLMEMPKQGMTLPVVFASACSSLRQPDFTR